MPKQVEYIFIRFDRIHERDRQTDGRTVDERTPHDGIGRACACSIARKKRLTFAKLMSETGVALPQIIIPVFLSFFFLSFFLLYFWHATIPSPTHT